MQAVIITFFLQLRETGTVVGPAFPATLFLCNMNYIGEPTITRQQAIAAIESLNLYTVFIWLGSSRVYINSNEGWLINRTKDLDNYIKAGWFFYIYSESELEWQSVSIID